MDNSEKTVIHASEETQIFAAPQGDATESFTALHPVADDSNTTNIMVNAAGPVLSVARQLPYWHSQPDVARLSQHLESALESFNQSCRQSGVVDAEIRLAHYCLCCLLDEGILSTPWGAQQWEQRTLLSRLHNERRGGERFFNVLDNIMREHLKYPHVLALLYSCLLLGFEGKYRIARGGQDKLQQILQQVERLMGEHVEASDSLSPQWQGAALQLRERGLPVWMVALGAGVLLLILFFSLRVHLNSLSDPLFERMFNFSAPQGLFEVPRNNDSGSGELVLIGVPEQLHSLQQNLAEPIDTGQLGYRLDPSRETVILSHDKLFESGSATLNPEFQPLIRQVAEALDKTSSPIKLTGHTDNIPIRTLRFPSNWALSQARAQAVAALLTEMGVAPERFEVLGRAHLEPLAGVDMNTAAGRALNRRIEISVPLEQ